MNVYLVVDHDYESDEILGIYVTRELAEAWKAVKSAYEVSEEDADAAYDAGDHEVYARRGTAARWRDASVEEHAILADTPDDEKGA